MSKYGNFTQEYLSGKLDVVTDELLTICNTIILATLAGVVALFGIITNVFNIVIFLKQGLKDTVNIALLALAVSDLFSLVALELVCIRNNQLYIQNVPMILIEVQHLTAAWPHACFARITSWITVYITLERCLCVVIPLKVKRIITPKVTFCVLMFISVALFLSLIPDYSTCYLDWKFVQEQNRSMLGLVFLPGRDQVGDLSFKFGVGTQMSSFGAVIVFTAILVFKMKQKLKWRRSNSSYSSDSSKENSTRDKRTVKMIILVAVIYCVCFLPMLGIYIAICIEPELIIFGVYNNTFFLVWSIVFLFDVINSSVNIFVYYRMSTNYRINFDSVFFDKVLYKKISKGTT